MANRILITGMGIISSLGKGVEANLAALTAGRSGIGKAEFLSTFHKDAIPVSEIKYSDRDLAEISEVREKKYVSRTTLLGLIAAREALNSARLTDLSSFRTAFISGNTVGGMGNTEKIFFEYLKPDCPQELAPFAEVHDSGQSTEVIASELGIKGFFTTISTACSSAANAVMLGARLIRNGMADRVIAGGVDALTCFTLNGFHSLLIVDKEHCKPFDKNRKGLNLGEGAGYLVLESEKAARAGNREILAELKGYANTNDAYHQTASSPDGNGAFLAMKKAMEMAGIKPGQVDYINVHGTGTPNNDLSEGHAMERVFPEIPRYSSTKAYTGHTLAAAGGIEAVYSLLSIRENIIFPNLNFTDKMDELNSVPITSLQRNAGVRTVLSNSFGFGGNNASLIFSAL